MPGAVIQELHDAAKDQGQGQDQNQEQGQSDDGPTGEEDRALVGGEANQRDECRPLLGVMEQ